MLSPVVPCHLCSLNREVSLLYCLDMISSLSVALLA